jgi:hypothetical protein
MCSHFCDFINNRAAPNPRTKEKTTFFALEHKCVKKSVVFLVFFFKLSAFNLFSMTKNVRTQHNKEKKVT